MTTRRASRRLPVLLSAVIAVTQVLGSLSASAQDGGGNGTGGQTIVIAPTHSYLLDILIVGALFGGAVFAICRSSRRS